MSKSLAWTRVPVAARRVAAGAGGERPAPLVAILCTPSRAQSTAAALALALARSLGARSALAAVVGEGPTSSLAGLPSACRTAAVLRERGAGASAGGRLVWLADRRGPLSADDVAGRAAALSAELGRSAVAVGSPAAVAIPVARTSALDRVLAWHDALVVVHEPDAAEGVVARTLTSLAELGRPVVAMTPTRKLSGALAVAGLAVPPEAAAAVVELALGAGADGG